MKFNPFLAILVSMMLAGCGEETSVSPTLTEEPSKEVSVAPTTTEEPITIPGLNLDMMAIPAGTFVMGSPNDEEGRDDGEGPQTTVTITKPFWLGKTEVTQALWKAVMGNNPSGFT